MKISFTKIAIVLSLCITIFISVCPPSFATPRRVEECGIESYVSKPDSACGILSYISKESPACGVERYKQQKSKECPDYKSADRGYFESSCPVDYSPTGSNKTECVESCDDCNKPRCIKKKYSVECVRSELIPTCSLPKFGVEKYKSCRHPSHEIEAFQTCSLPVFGVAQYKECDIRKTKAELISYIQGLEPNIDVMGVALIQNTGNLLKLGGNETAMACYIKRWESDPLYKDALDELKNIQFPALFGVAYDPSNYDCSNPPPLSVSTESCSDGTPRCKFQTAYNAALKFFETNKAEVAALLDDIASRTDGTYKTQLESLNATLDSYYKP